MLKRMVLLRRRRDITRDAFCAHWSGPHAEIARRYPGLARYTQNHVVRRFDPAAADGYACDGMAELWFDDQAAMRAALASPVAGALIADEPRFLTGVTSLVLGEAPPDDAIGGMKVIVLGRRRPGAVLDIGTVQGMHSGSAAAVVSTYGRDHLWQVPNPPDTVLIARFEAPWIAQTALDAGVWPPAGALQTWHAYQVDEIKIV